MSEFLFSVFLLACVRRAKTKATDCLSESSLFINSWLILYAFGDKVERSKTPMQFGGTEGDVMRVVRGFNEVSSSGS